MNVNAILEWVKSNVFIVVFSVLMIASLVAVPMIASGMNQGIQEEVDRRARNLTSLSQLERTQVAVAGGAAAGETQPGIVNEQLLQQFRDSVRVAQEDADQVLAAAMAHNRKDRGVLMDQVFPAPPSHRAEVIPRRFFERVRQAYRELIEEVNAGSPPDIETLRRDIERREIQFRTHTLSKEANDPLTEEEQRELASVLSGLRLLRYEEAAEQISMYATLDALQLPQWEEGRLPSLSEMFEWQWRYWIHEDLLGALHKANQSDPSVLQAPVKRLVWAEISESAAAGRSEGGQAAGGAGGGGGLPINPRSEAPRDFSVSLTGRTTNPLYDVRYIDVELIVDAARIPEVLDALSQQNFFTVIGLRKSPADSYRAAANGYFYGPAAVARVWLRLETVWFREWTSEFMPEEVKRRLGVATREQPVMD